MRPRPFMHCLLLAVLAGSGCGDDTSASTDADSDSATSTGSATGSSTSPTSTTTTATSTSTTSATASTSEDSTDGSSTSGSTSGDTTGSVPIVTVEVERYESQPMVVDVTLTADVPVSAFSLTHDTDPGVRISTMAVGDDMARYRIRGLAPATDHGLSFTADTAAGPVDFATHDALPGFVPAFAVAGSAPTARPFRAFDLAPFPALDSAGIFMVDETGTTRWYLGGTNTALPGPESIWAGLKLLDDGTVLHLLDHTLYIRNELGETLLQIDDQDLPVDGLHHEVLELENGNFLALSFSFRTIDYPGFGPTLTAGDLIVEFDPTGTLVWSWDAFDHLDPQRTTEPVGISIVIHPGTGEATYDWTHGNGIEYDESSGVMLLSLRHQDWIVAIDHATGDVEWILGDGGDFTLTSGDWFYHQHSAQWQPDGSLALYDNGVGRPDTPTESEFARAARYELDLVNMTAELVWEDDAADFVSTIAGDCDLNPGAGTFVVTDSAIPGGGGIYARIRELDPEANPMTQWSLQTPDGTFVYRTIAADRLIGEPLR